MIWELVEESCPAARNSKVAKAFEKVTTDHFGTFVKMGQHMEIQNQPWNPWFRQMTIQGRSQRSKAGPCGTTPRCQEGSDDAATVPVDLLSLSSLLSQANWELHVSSHVFSCRIVHVMTSHHIISYNIININQHSANTSLCVVLCIVYLCIYLFIYLVIVNTPTTIFIVIIICMSLIRVFIPVYTIII